MAAGEITKTSSEVSKTMSKETKMHIKDLDKPLNNLSNNSDIKKSEVSNKDNQKEKLKDLDKPLNSEKVKEAEKVERMEPPITITFKCPEGMDRKEFTRQLKAQERGINGQTIAENMDNRAAYNARKIETGNGRDTESGKQAQETARKKAMQSRIESNQKKGMSYKEAKEEAQKWISTQEALHNPDQVAGGDPAKVSRMGDASVNSSIGRQWGYKVSQLEKGVEDYAKGKSRETLENTKMNVKLVVE